MTLLRSFNLLTTISILVFSLISYGQTVDVNDLVPQNWWNSEAPLNEVSNGDLQGIQIAQYGDDAYDPFADFSEYENSAEEEADINFFLNGRFFTLGFIGGFRTWTQTLGQIYDPAPNFGLFLSYFFDLRFAMQVSFVTGDHILTVEAADPPLQGNVGLSSVGIDLKYYMNTQNVTRGLAELNPYLLGGFSQNYRTITVSGEDAFAKDSALGFDIGAGLEIPLLSNKMFFGLQVVYQLINFDDENQEIFDANDNATGIFPSGDTYTIYGVLGVNF